MLTLLHQSNDGEDGSSARRQATGVKPLVLVAEDHEDTRFMLRYLLEMWGCRVVLAEDGEMAVCAAEEMLPQLILIDASLPRLDGLEATRRIRKHAALMHVPIVFLSGHAQESFRLLALGTGVNDYLIKPFELAQLERILNKHLPAERNRKGDHRDI